MKSHRNLMALVLCILLIVIILIVYSNDMGHPTVTHGSWVTVGPIENWPEMNGNDLYIESNQIMLYDNIEIMNSGLITVTDEFGNQTILSNTLIINSPGMISIELYTDK